MMIPGSYGMAKERGRGINGCDRAEAITYSRRRVLMKEEREARGEPMARTEGAVSLPLVAKKCQDCKTTTTPLWRSGPGGPKSLCNACGIKFGKSKYKREPAVEGSKKGSSEMWEELKRRQKEKQQKLLLILLQQQRDKAKNRKQMSTISRSRNLAASAFGKAAKKKRSKRKRGGGSGKGDREAEAAALLLLSLSSASYS